MENSTISKTWQAKISATSVNKIRRGNPPAADKALPYRLFHCRAGLARPELVEGPRRNILMFEMSFAGEDHSDAVFVGGGDDLVIFLRAARLGDCDDSRLCGIIDIVREWKERVGGHNGTLRLFACVFDCDETRLNSVHLARADADDFTSFGKHDGVAFCMLGGKPGDAEVRELFIGGFCFRRERSAISAPSRRGRVSG